MPDLNELLSRLDSTQLSLIACALFAAAAVSVVAGHEIAKRYKQLQNPWFYLLLVVWTVILLLLGSSVIYWIFKNPN